MEALLLIALIIGLVVWTTNYAQKGGRKQVEERRFLQLEDSRADAGRWIDRLGGQVLHLTGNDEVSNQAMADASERFNAATGQLQAANTPNQLALAKDTAIEGLYYVRAARMRMGMDPGPEIPKTSEQQKAGAVTERRTIEHEGHSLTASPDPSDQTPHYYPGGMVAGRPVPAGWYSEPWWASALHTGVWAMTSMMMFNMMFAGMAGVPYGGEQFASGAGDADAGGGDMGDGGGDMGDGGGDMGDGGGDMGDGGGGLFDGGLFGGGGDGGGGGLFDSGLFDGLDF